GMTFWVRLIIYAGTVLLYVMTAAWIVRAWPRRRYRDKSPSDLHSIAVVIVLVLSAGLGVLVASHIGVVLFLTGQEMSRNSALNEHVPATATGRWMRRPVSLGHAPPVSGEVVGFTPAASNRGREAHIKS